MSCVELFSRWARELEEREAARSGVTKPVARAIVARRLRVVPGTLENIVRGRLKDIGHELAERLRGAIANELLREISRLERELELARACGPGPDRDEIDAAHAALEQAYRLLRK